MPIKEDIEAAEDDKERLNLILWHFGCKNGSIHRIGDDGLLHLSAVWDGWNGDVIKTIPVTEYPCYEKNNSYSSAEIGEEVDGGEKYQKSNIDSPIQNAMGVPVGVFRIEKEGHGVGLLTNVQLNELHYLARFMN